MDPEPPLYAYSSGSQRRGRRSASVYSSGGPHITQPTAASRPPVEHRYHLTNSNGHPWLTLKVVSNAPASTFLPTFHAGETINGSVMLSLSKEDSIKAVSIQVRTDYRMLALRLGCL